MSMNCNYHLYVFNYFVISLIVLPLEWNKIGIELQHQANKMAFSILLKEYLFSLIRLDSLDGLGEPPLYLKASKEIVNILFSLCERSDVPPNPTPTDRRVGNPADPPCDPIVQY
jgi:hypothetical protein